MLVLTLWFVKEKVIWSETWFELVCVYTFVRLRRTLLSAACIHLNAVAELQDVCEWFGIDGNSVFYCVIHASGVRFSWDNR